jgi:cell division protein FtsB
MSTVFSPARAAAPSRTTPAARPSARLSVVREEPFRPPRMPFVLFVVTLLAAGLVGLLLLNTELQRGTFQVTELNKQADELRVRQQALEQQARTLDSPQHLADRALKLGMVPNPNPVFIRLSDGRVLGVPEAGKRGTGETVFGPVLPKPKPTVKPVTPPTTTTPIETRARVAPTGG